MLLLSMKDVQQLASTRESNLDIDRVLGNIGFIERRDMELWNLATCALSADHAATCAADAKDYVGNQQRGE